MGFLLYRYEDARINGQPTVEIVGENSDDANGIYNSLALDALVSHLQENRLTQDHLDTLRFGDERSIPAEIVSGALYFSDAVTDVALVDDLGIEMDLHDDDTASTGVRFAADSFPLYDIIDHQSPLPEEILAKATESTHEAQQHELLLDDDGRASIRNPDSTHQSLGIVDDDGRYHPRITVLNHLHPVRQLIEEAAQSPTR